MNLCSRECPGCYKWKGLGHFYATFGDLEYKYCSTCRINGKTTEPYTSWGSLVTTNYPRYPTSYVSINRPKKPEYFEIEVEDVSTVWNDPLLYGEQWITWDRLRRDSAKKSKQRCRNRAKKRRDKPPPWKIYEEPRSEYEKEVRERYERMWKCGMDECLPLYLLKCKTWSQFWYRHKVRPGVQKRLEKEGGEKFSWKRPTWQDTFNIRS
jgi:hypothetical protein